MEKKEFVISGRKLLLEEEDYIAAYIFQILYEPMSRNLLEYKKKLVSMNDCFDLKKVKKCLIKKQNEENLDIDEKILYSEIINYMENEELRDICLSIEVVFEIAENIIKDAFEENDNYGIELCDVVQNIKNFQEEEARERYDKLVLKSDSSVKGKTFEECKESIVSDIYFDKLRSKGSPLELESYWDLGYEFETGDDASEAYQTIAYFKEPKNLESWCKKLEEICMVCLVGEISRFLQNCKIPTKTRYFTDANYQKFILLNEALLEKKENDNSVEACVNNLRTFPFLTKAYIPILQVVGDSDKELESFACELKVNITEAKKYLYDEFVKNEIQVDMNDECDVQAAYKKIINYKKFLGYEDVQEAERRLIQRLSELDDEYRTVNGVIYETRQQADEIRSRSFEGKEYANKKEAELVRMEVQQIRNIYQEKSVLSKYRKFEQLSAKEWKTTEAKNELEQLKRIIDSEYVEIEKKGNQEEVAVDKLKKKSGIFIILAVGSCLFNIKLGVFVITLGMIVIVNAYEQVKKSRKAKMELFEINKEYGKYQTNKENTIQKIGGSNQKICANCGSEIDDEMKFCAKCGVKLSQ